MEPIQFPLRYTRQEILAGQRLRFRNNLRVWLLGIIATGLFVYLLGKQYVPDFSHLKPTDAAPVAIALLLLAAGGTAFTFIVVPWFDYLFNNIWKRDYTLSLSDDKIRLSVAGRAAGFQAPWQQVRKVYQDGRLYVLVFKKDQEFFILPRRVFSDPAQEQRFRRWLIKKSSITPKMAESLQKS